MKNTFLLTESELRLIIGVTASAVVHNKLQYEKHSELFGKDDFLTKDSEERYNESLEAFKILSAL